MEATDLLPFLLASVLGGALGLFYFGGLWWTLEVLSQKRRAKTFLILSFAIRACIALLGFWIILRKSFLSFFLTLGVFFLARVIITRKLRLPAQGKGDEYAD